MDAMLFTYDHVTSPHDVIRYAVADTVVTAAVPAITMATPRRTCNEKLGCIASIDGATAAVAGPMSS